MFLYIYVLMKKYNGSLGEKAMNIAGQIAKYEEKGF
jgi:hypothetical protein